MDTISPYLESITNTKHREKLKAIVEWISANYPDLDSVIKWNQPMFVHGETYIIGFSVAKAHLSFSPEKACIDHFEQAVLDAGYKRTQMLVQIKWNHPIDYTLIAKMIDYNIKEKAGSKQFWRQS